MINIEIGADHIWCIKMETRSNLFTSLATKLTTFPGAVSPSAVLLSRNAYYVKKKNYMFILCMEILLKFWIKMQFY